MRSSAVKFMWRASISPKKIRAPGTFPICNEISATWTVSSITFAHWEEGFIVRQGNPKKIRAVSDIAKPTVRIVNREKGSGARRLLDKQLRASAINPKRIKGYGDEVFSHLDVASRVKSGLADAGIGVQSVASICGLDFVPLQRERYDLVIPKAHYETLHGLRVLLDTIVSKPFTDELDALGGYDTREIGKVVEASMAG